jgi:glutaminyl-peptide cyclotransferase
MVMRSKDSKRENFFLMFFIILVFSCTKDERKEQSTTTQDNSFTYTILTTLPHDREAFTEGLEIYDGKILESTGQHGKSWIAEIDPALGNPQKKVLLPEEYFGEGITVLNSKLYHLTYKTRVGFIYDAKTYKKIGQFEYDSKIKEGWGLTHNESNLILSDGTDKIHFLDTSNFSVVRSISIKEGHLPIRQINELEFVHGHIFANVWETDWILKIDPETGGVVGRLDLSAIVARIRAMYPRANELNGIAYDKNSNALLVTGKNWPESFLIRVTSR